MGLYKFGTIYNSTFSKCAITNCRQIFKRTVSLQPDGKDLVVEKLQGEKQGITVFGLNRIEGKNSLCESLVYSILRAIEGLQSDTETRVVILKSNVPGIFCAGADLKERLKMPAERVGAFVTGLRQMMRNLETVPVPVIAAMDGAAVGGGLEMALSCDIRIAAENIKMGLVETKLAIIPGAGGSQRLPRLINPSIAKELIYTARLVTGKEAKELGIINHAVLQNEKKTGAYEKALELAMEILPNGPVALKMAKRAINEGLQHPLHEAFKIEEQCYSNLIDTDDRVEGLKAFSEKRKPMYKGK